MMETAVTRPDLALNTSAGHQATFSSAKLKIALVTGAGFAAMGYSFALSQPAHYRSNAASATAPAVALVRVAPMSSAQILPRHPSATIATLRATDLTSQASDLKAAARSRETPTGVDDLVAATDNGNVQPNLRVAAPREMRQPGFSRGRHMALHGVGQLAGLDQDCKPAYTSCQSGSVAEDRIPAQEAIQSGPSVDPSALSLKARESAGSDSSRVPDVGPGLEAARLELAPPIQLAPVNIVDMVPPVAAQHLDFASVEPVLASSAHDRQKAIIQGRAEHRESQQLAIGITAVTVPQRSAVGARDAGPSSKSSVKSDEPRLTTPKSSPSAGKARSVEARLKTEAQERTSVSSLNQNLARSVDQANSAAYSLMTQQAIARPRQTAKGIEFSVPTHINGQTVGSLGLLIGGADEQHPQYASDEISVRLVDLLNLLSSRIRPELFNKLSSSRNAQVYVTLNELRSSGIAVSFADDDSLIIKAAMHR
jgi:hypothetical protein